MAWKPNYATTAELAAYVRIDDPDDDAELSLAIAAASRAVDDTCQRQFGKVDAPVARYFTARIEGGRSVVHTTDLTTDVGLVVEADTAGDGTFSTVVTPSCTAGPRNAVQDGRPYSRITSRVGLPLGREAVRVTGLWGWSSVPDAVKQAALLQASRFLARRDSPYGVTGSPDSGGELRLLAKVDPDVAVALRPFQRRWWAF